MTESRRIRILFPFTSKSIGGSHFSSLNLIRNLDRQRFEPLIVLHGNGPFGNYLRDQGIPHSVLPLRCYPAASRRSFHALELLRITPPLLWYLLSRKIDIVHTNDSRIHHTWAIAAQMIGKKFIWHLRTTEFSRGNRFVPLAQKADRIVCVSEYIRSTLPKTLRPNSQVIYNPFDTVSVPPNRAAARRRLLDELALPEDVDVVGFFANFLERKRPDVFVEAAAKISQVLGRRVVFAMYGDDRTGVTPVLRQRSEALGISDQVHMMGFRSPVEPLMAACDVMLVPALDEPFGRTPVEATLVGTPLVAVRSGGHTEYIKDSVTGLLANRDDPETLAQGAIYLLNNPASAQRMVAEGQRITKQVLSISTHVEQIAQLYEEILAQPPARAHSGAARDAETRAAK
jgi:glycosyltransferase involved in cell wall biosynthesis